MSLSIYISGPMTGKKDLNYPAFKDVAELLRSNGHRVLNPAEITPPTPSHCHYLGKRGLWVWFMKEALKMMFGAYVIVLLPGWKKSKGAKIERWLGKLLDYQVYELDEFVDRFGIVF